MISDFAGKVAVVTGGTGGIGGALAARFLCADMNVVITGTRDETIAKAVARLGGGDRLLAVKADVADSAANDALAARVEEHFGGADLVCLNAGISRAKFLAELSPEVWRQQMAVNVDGAFYGMRAFHPQLSKREQAHYVVMSSALAVAPGPIAGPYYASKAALLSFAESLLADLTAAGSSIGVSCVMPGNTRTDMALNSATPDADPEIIAAAHAELESGTDPSVVADATFEAVRTNQFYVLPNTGELWSIIDARHRRIMTQTNPRLEDTSI
jgi:NAD(P)-dependent dehydrogenase (short-subunit alcohol dehydrogenase family)